MKKTLPLVFLLTTFFATHGVAEESVRASTSPSTGIDISAAYFGELIMHPGIAAGAKFPLVDKSWYDLTLGPTVGFYVHPRNHTSLFVDGELENRFTAPFGLFGTLGGALGYQHAWLGGDVYVRDDDGGVDTRFDWGRPYLKSGLSFGLGWDFEKNRVAPLRIFARLDAFGRAPFNRAILPHAALQVGAVYRFGGSK